MNILGELDVTELESVIEDAKSLVDYFGISTMINLSSSISNYNNSQLPSYFLFLRNSDLSSPQSSFLYKILRKQERIDKYLNTIPLLLAIKTILAERTRFSEEIELIDFILSGGLKEKQSINTRTILLDMISKAEQEIIILSYLYVNTAKEILDVLRKVNRSGVKLSFFAEEKTIKKIAKTLRVHDIKSIKYYKYVSSTTNQSMHAKVILVDNKDLLVT